LRGVNVLADESYFKHLGNNFTVSQVVRSRRLGWLGRVTRMNDKQGYQMKSVNGEWKNFTRDQADNGKHGEVRLQTT